MKLQIVRLRPKATLPEYATAGAAGLDLAACERRWIEPGDQAYIATGIAVAIPEGYEGQVRLRSSLGQRGIMIPHAPGTIDSDYRGEIIVPVFNFGPDDLLIEAGARIAQLVIAPVVRVTLIEVQALPESERGAGGFGSTGR